MSKIPPVPYSCASLFMTTRDIHSKSSQMHTKPLLLACLLCSVSSGRVCAWRTHCSWTRWISGFSAMRVVCCKLLKLNHPRRRDTCQHCQQEFANHICKLTLRPDNYFASCAAALQSNAHRNQRCCCRLSFALCAA